MLWVERSGWSNRRVRSRRNAPGLGGGETQTVVHAKRMKQKRLRCGTVGSRKNSYGRDAAKARREARNLRYEGGEEARGDDQD